MLHGYIEYTHRGQNSLHPTHLSTVLTEERYQKWFWDVWIFYGHRWAPGRPNGLRRTSKGNEATPKMKRPSDRWCCELKGLGMVWFRRHKSRWSVPRQIPDCVIVVVVVVELFAQGHMADGATVYGNKSHTHRYESHSNPQHGGLHHSTLISVLTKRHIVHWQVTNPPSPPSPSSSVAFMVFSSWKCEAQSFNMVLTEPVI